MSDDSGYEQCLEAAGAVVHDFKEFGSYQGDWYAKVTFNGETGWINGCFGSCSECDAFEGEFGYHQDGCDEHCHSREDCPECGEKLKKYQARLAAFGMTYIDTMMTQAEIEKYAEKNCLWSAEDDEALKWLKAHAVPGGWK